MQRFSPLIVFLSCLTLAAQAQSSIFETQGLALHPIAVRQPGAKTDPALTVVHAVDWTREPTSQLHTNILTRWFLKQAAGILTPMLPDYLPDHERLALEPKVRFASMEAWLEEVLALAVRAPLPRDALLLGAALDSDLPIVEMLVAYRRVVLLDRQRKGLEQTLFKAARVLEAIGLSENQLLFYLQRAQLLTTDFAPTLRQFVDRLRARIGPAGSREEARQILQEEVARVEAISVWPSPLSASPPFHFISATRFFYEPVLEGLNWYVAAFLAKFGDEESRDRELIAQLQRRLWRAYLPQLLKQLSELLVPGGTLLWVDKVARVTEGQTTFVGPLAEFEALAGTFFTVQKLDEWFWDHGIPAEFRVKASMERLAAYRLSKAV